MTDSQDNHSKLPQKLAATIRKEIFNYGKFTDLSEAQLVGLLDALAYYYPPTEDEESSALLLREWLTVRQVSEEVAKPVKRLDDLSEAAVREWRNTVDRLHHEREYRYKRGFPGEGRSDARERLLKDFHYKKLSVDPEGLIAALDMIVEEALAKSLSVAVGAPPQVQISDELVKLAREMAERNNQRLMPYVERVAKAKHILARFVRKIAAIEAIYSDGD